MTHLRALIDNGMKLPSVCRPRRRLQTKPSGQPLSSAGKMTPTTSPLSFMSLTMPRSAIAW
jgi:hypothetical protein